MAHVEAKRNNFNVAQEYYLQGKEVADKNKDKEYTAKFKILEDFFLMVNII